MPGLLATLLAEYQQARPGRAMALQAGALLLVLAFARAVEATARLGIDDAGYFSRFFTRSSGTPPSVYRARVRQGLVAQPQAGAVSQGRGRPAP